MTAPVRITVSATVAVPAATAWVCWTDPACITRWNAASDDWHTPRAANDLRVGGRFTARMEAKDGSAGFDFSGTYTAVEEGRRLAYVMEDGRTAEVTFAEEAGGTRITETFDAETENPVDLQRDGWQAILERFTRHAEAHAPRRST